MFMLQRIRDEAHRFANTFHRELRGKRMKRGLLDGVVGLGEARKTRLIKEFGGVKGVKAASLESLLEVSWLPEAVARAVHERVTNDD
jgi:excinuclease ABC subunit C